MTKTIRLEKILELLTGIFATVVGSQTLQRLPSLGFRVGLELLLLGLQKIDKGHPARIIDKGEEHFFTPKGRLGG